MFILIKTNVVLGANFLFLMTDSKGSVVTYKCESMV